MEELIEHLIERGPGRFRNALRDHRCDRAAEPTTEEYSSFRESLLHYMEKAKGDITRERGRSLPLHPDMAHARTGLQIAHCVTSMVASGNDWEKVQVWRAYHQACDEALTRAGE